MLVVLERDDANSWLSVRNLADIHLLSPDQLNTYDVLVSDEIVFTASALEAFIAGGRAGVADQPESEEDAK